jgi:hypothetical protein
MSRDIYSNLGLYITSLTPTKFTAKIWTIEYCDIVMKLVTNGAQIIQYIHQNPDNLPQGDPSGMVDFSNELNARMRNFRN